MIHITNNPKETKKIGHFLFNQLILGWHKKALVVSLSGELGTGKTTFVQGLARLLGVKTKIKSPTFALIKKYKLSPDSKLRPKRYLYHIDCYRLKNHRDLLVLGIRDILKDKDNVLLIEWPERIKKILPKKHTKIRFEHIDKTTRKISIT